MNKLFDLNSPYMVFLSKVADLVILSFWWFVCCLPVITIGPATAAMYYVALKIARKEEIRVTGTFFKGFKDNFKQGVAYTLIFAVLLTVLVWDYLIMSGVEGTLGMLSSVCFLVLAVWLLCTMFYTFPLQAQFFNPVVRTLKNAMILSTQKLLTTVYVFVLNMLPVIVAFISLPVFVQLAPVWILLTPALTAYLCSLRFVKIFDPWLQPAQAEETQG